MFEHYKNFDIDQIFEVMRRCLAEHDVNLIADIDFRDLTPSLLSSNAYTFLDEEVIDMDLIDSNDYLNPKIPRAGLVLMMFEAFSNLDEVHYTLNDKQYPFITDPENNCFVLNENCNIPMSMFLLSFDRTVEKMKSLAKENSFYDGSCISPVWLTRAIKILSGDDSTPALANAMSV